MDTLQIKAALAEITADGSPGGKESILDCLWQLYEETHPVTDIQVRSCEQALEPIFEELSLGGQNTLFDQLVELCAAYQQTAFREGFRLGLRLQAELQ